MGGQGRWEKETGEGESGNCDHDVIMREYKRKYVIKYNQNKHNNVRWLCVRRICAHVNVVFMESKQKHMLELVLQKVGC